MVLKKLQKYDIVIFDCDGVLIDINLLKCEAFGKAVEEYPKNIVDGFVNHCKETFGISRYVKFKEFFDIYAKEPFDIEKYNMFLNRYGQLCKKNYIQANLTPGLRKVLSLLKNSEYKLYVASGSDEKELIEVLGKRDLTKYFTRIYGSPKKKSEGVSEILEENPGLKTVFVGDAISDLNVAKQYNVDFIYMSEYSVQSKMRDEICRKEATMVINTLEELL